jgi:hypothetical protein
MTFLQSPLLVQVQFLQHKCFLVSHAFSHIPHLYQVRLPTLLIEIYKMGLNSYLEDWQT